MWNSEHFCIGLFHYYHQTKLPLISSSPPPHHHQDDLFQSSWFVQEETDGEEISTPFSSLSGLSVMATLLQISQTSYLLHLIIIILWTTKRNATICFCVLVLQLLLLLQQHPNHKCNNNRTTQRMKRPPNQTRNAGNKSIQKIRKE